MMRKIIQIKGTHGSGKSTICKQLIALSSDVQILNWENGKPYATVLNDLKWAILGTYPEHIVGGGCDNLNSDIRRIEIMKKVILELYNDYPEYWIVFEGALIGNSMTLYNHISNNIPRDEIGVVFLYSDLATCMQRLELRRGSPLENDHHVVDKLNNFNRNINKHLSEHRYSIYTNQLTRDDMVFEFLSVVGWKPNGQTTATQV